MKVELIKSSQRPNRFSWRIVQGKMKVEPNGDFASVAKAKTNLADLIAGLRLDEFMVYDLTEEVVKPCAPKK